MGLPQVPGKIYQMSWTKLLPAYYMEYVIGSWCGKLTQAILQIPLLHLYKTTIMYVFCQWNRKCIQCMWISMTLSIRRAKTVTEPAEWIEIYEYLHQTPYNGVTGRRWRIFDTLTKFCFFVRGTESLNSTYSVLLSDSTRPMRPASWCMLPETTGSLRWD
jgi:hypothetical protein